MKTLLLLLLITFCILNNISGKARVEAQVGGANFMGITINSRFAIPLNDTKVHQLSPTFGIGMLALWWDEPTAIINAGITYNYKSWGIGTEISGFSDLSTVVSRTPRDFVDMIVYPNLNYTFQRASNWYFRISGGVYFAYSKSNGSTSENIALRFEGDVIPGAGIGLGYMIR